MSVVVGLRGENLNTIFTKAGIFRNTLIRYMKNEKVCAMRYWDIIQINLLNKSEKLMEMIYCIDIEYNEQDNLEILKLINCLKADLNFGFLYEFINKEKAPIIMRDLDDLLVAYKAWSKSLKIDKGR